MVDKSKIKLDILLNSKEKAEWMLRQFAQAYNVKWRLKKDKEKFKYIWSGIIGKISELLPPINEEIRKIVKEELRKKRQREGKSTSGREFDSLVNIELDVHKKFGKDKYSKKHRRLSAENQRVNCAYDVLEKGHIETDLPNGAKLDEDGNSPEDENPNPNDNPRPETPVYVCVKCGRNDKPHYVNRKNGEVWCSECYNERTPESPHEKNGLKEHPTGGSCSGPGEFPCGAKKSAKWRKGKTENSKKKYYCEKCWDFLWKGQEEPNDTPPPRTPPRNPLREEIDNAIAEIQTALREEPRVIENELESRFRGYRQAFELSVHPQQIHTLKDQVLADIRAKRDKKKKNEDNNDPLFEQKMLAIDSIEFYLSKEPRVEVDELEAVNQNFLEKISQADDKNQVDAIASQVLKNIQQIRDSKTKDQDPAILLENLKTETIKLINQELKIQPKLSQSDISYPNWEKEIEEATEESQIIKVRDSVLAELKNKRENQVLEVKIIELISQGQSASTFEELSPIITQLKNFSSTDAYQKHQEEIDALETELHRLDPAKYNQQTETELKNQVENNGLTENQLSEETKKALAKAKETGSPADKKTATNLVNQDIAQVKLDELVQKALTILSNDDKFSKIEKEQLAAQIEEFIGKDEFKKAAYQKKASQINQLLNQLRGEKQTSAPTSPEPTWPKALMISGLIIIPLSLVALIVALQQKKKRRR